MNPSVQNAIYQSKHATFWNDLVLWTIHRHVFSTSTWDFSRCLVWALVQTSLRTPTLHVSDGDFTGWMRTEGWAALFLAVRESQDVAGHFSGAVREALVTHAGKRLVDVHLQATVKYVLWIHKSDWNEEKKRIYIEVNKPSHHMNTQRTAWRYVLADTDVHVPES